VSSRVDELTTGSPIDSQFSGRYEEAVMTGILLISLTRISQSRPVEEVERSMPSKETDSQGPRLEFAVIYLQVLGL